MKTLLFIASLAVALIAQPVLAQQGPAGVPGAPGLAPPPPPPPPAVVVAPPPEQVKASKSAPTAKCGNGQSGTKACKPKKPAACSSNADPARCEQYRKTRELCKNLPESDYRQCLRDNLTAKK